MEDKSKPLAFVSCSLWEEDKPFVELVEHILQKCGIRPFGTVGKYSAAPINPAELMKKNIAMAEMVVLVATPRYDQKDVFTGSLTKGIGEMLHVESGIAHASGKPLIVFVKEGTSVGSFLGNVTQYITLSDKNDLKNESKSSLIVSLINSAFAIINQNREKASTSQITRLITGGLAIWGGLKVLESLTADEPTSRKRKARKKY